MPESESTRKARENLQRELDGYRRAVSWASYVEGHVVCEFRSRPFSDDAVLEDHRNGLIGSLRSYFRAVSSDRAHEISESELERLWYLRKLEGEMPSIEAEVIPVIMNGESLGMVDVDSIHQFFMGHVERREGQAKVLVDRRNSNAPMAALQSANRVEDSGGSRPPNGESQPVAPTDGGTLAEQASRARLRCAFLDQKLDDMNWSDVDLAAHGGPAYNTIQVYRSGKITRRARYTRKKIADALKCDFSTVPK